MGSWALAKAAFCQPRAELEAAGVMEAFPPYFHQTKGGGQVAISLPGMGGGGSSGDAFQAHSAPKHQIRGVGLSTPMLGWAPEAQRTKRAPKTQQAAQGPSWEALADRDPELPWNRPALS